MMNSIRTVVFAAVALCAVQLLAANTHTVTFRKMDGTVLMQTNVVHGADATSLAPAGPDESAAGLAFSRWDFAEKLACVTNDVTCWALYEATTPKSPSTTIASQSVANRETPYSLEEYFQMYNNLAWSDEFSGDSLDIGTAHTFFGYTYYTGGNWVNDTGKNNDEQQTYTDGKNQSVSDGTLKLVCKRESSTSVTSGKVTTKGKVAFTLGRCEIRAKITKEYGSFPAFWTMGNIHGWPNGGEIDIMEQVNGSDWIGNTLHMPRAKVNDSDNPYESNGDITSTEDVHWGYGFHRIGIIVNERELVWYVDDHVTQRQDIRDADKYDILRTEPQFILLNYAFGGGWSGVTNLTMSSVANFQQDDFEIDYCRIFTNTNAGNTVARVAEPDGARLSGPVKATVWRGWQMNYDRAGSSYYRDHLIGKENIHIRTALREYLGRDSVDIVTFLTRTTLNSGGEHVEAPFNVPGYTTVHLSPVAGRGWTDWDREKRMRVLSTVIFNKERFSQSNSSVSTLELSGNYDFTNCCAVVAELVERDTGAKVKVVSVMVTSIADVNTSGSVAANGFDALISKLSAMKNEKVILLLQGDDVNNDEPRLDYIENRVNAELTPAYAKIGRYKSYWAHQSAWATTNCISASGENPAALTLGTSNQYANQSFCATVQFEAEPEPVVAAAFDAPGYDYTNRVVTVTNATANSQLVLTATASDGTTTTATATVDANGEATFNIATSPGAEYSYAVSRGGDTIATGGFFTGGWNEGNTWFSASAATGASVVSGGGWSEVPAISGNKYSVDGSTEFALDAGAAAAGSGRFVRLDFDYSFDALCDADGLIGATEPEYGSFAAAMRASTGAALWMASGAGGWIPLYGDIVPSEGQAYIVRMETELAANPPRIRYAVSADNGATFDPLYTDSSRTARWVTGAASGNALSGVVFNGQGAVKCFGGTVANANVAEADGVGYESLADAIAAATNSLTLLTNATWPTNTPVGTVALNRGGFAVRGVTLDGNDKVVVSSGYSQIPGEGRVNITLAQAQALGVATANKSPAEIASALAANGANGIPLWKSYVLGLDPTVATAKPKATIAMNGDKVDLPLIGIDVNAAAGATVTYKVYKASDIANIKNAQPASGDKGVGETAQVPKDAAAPKMFYRLKVDVKGY